VCVCSYLVLLTQYEAVSFCDAVFASYVLLPLQQRHSVLLRKAVWGEHVNVLRSLSLPANQASATTNASNSSNTIIMYNNSISGSVRVVVKEVIYIAP